MVDKDDPQDKTIGYKTNRVAYVTARQCRREITYRTLLATIGVIVFTAYLYLMARSIEMLSSDSSLEPYILLLAAVILMSLWPLILIVSFTINALLEAKSALWTYRNKKFVSKPWPTALDTHRRIQFIENHPEASETRANHHINTLLDYHKAEDILQVTPLFDIKIDRSTATWYRLASKKQPSSYVLLRFNLSKHSLPMIVVNSHVELGSILPHRYKNGTVVSIGSDIDKTVQVTSVHGAQKYARSLLTADDLRRAGSAAGNFDIEISRDHIDFIWHEDIVSDALFIGRTKAASTFVKTLQQRQQIIQTSYTDERLIPRLTHDDQARALKPALNVFVSGSIVLTLVTTLGMTLTGYSALKVVATAASLVALLVAICLTFFVTFGATRLVKATKRRITAVHHMQNQALYHETTHR